MYNPDSEGYGRTARRKCRVCICVSTNLRRCSHLSVCGIEAYKLRMSFVSIKTDGGTERYTELKLRSHDGHRPLHFHG